MLWVFAAAVACSLTDGGAPTSAHLHGSDDDSAIDGDGDGYDAGVDCDDHEPRVHPGTEETCGNRRDDNCNGTADGCDWSGELALEGTKLTTTDDASAMGTSLVVCDANGDGVGDVVVGAPWYFNEMGAVHVFYGPIVDDRDTKDADQSLIGMEHSLAGYSIDCRRDIDDDAVADIVVGQPWGASPTPGAVYVVPGGGMGLVKIADEASSTWFGSDDGDQFGHQLVAIDADGDETDDLAVALGSPEQPATEFGTVYVIDDSARGEHPADAASAYVYGVASDRLDSVVGNAGDLDGDGLEELVAAGTEGVVATALVFTAPFQGAIPKSDADVRIVGGSPGVVHWSGIGHADLDADGRDDLLLANESRDNYDGAAYVFFAPIEADTAVAFADLRILGPVGEYFGAGSDVTSPGDVDGDGIPDLLIGTLWGGTVYLQYGGDRGVYLLEKDAQAWWQPKDWQMGDGTTVAAGDVTGDGVVEFVIGSPWGGAAGEGSVTIVPAFQL